MATIFNVTCEPGQYTMVSEGTDAVRFRPGSRYGGRVAIGHDQPEPEHAAHLSYGETEWVELHGLDGEPVWWKPGDRVNRFSVYAWSPGHPPGQGTVQGTRPPAGPEEPEIPLV